MKTRLTLTALALALPLTLATACESRPKTVRPQTPSVNVEASRQTMLPGESILLFARTQNLLGTNPSIRWEATIGRVTPQDNGRRALFTSDTPGVAIVTAEVNAEGALLRDYEKITIHDLK